MNHELTTRREVIRFDGNNRTETVVSLIHEVPLTIFLNGQELVTLLCTGHHVEELALGFLKSEGLLDDLEDVKGLQVDKDAGMVRVEMHGEEALRRALYLKRTLGSGCGRASLYYQPLDGLQIRPIEDDLKVTPGQIWALMRGMGRGSTLYKESRGTHHAALAQGDRIVVGREDIGRHNAVDMIVGHALREGLSMGDKILLTTGRASSEIVLKAARLSIPVLASRSTATLLAVEIAERVGMTLAGYVRGEKMVLYAHPERVVEPPEAAL